MSPRFKALLALGLSVATDAPAAISFGPAGTGLLKFDALPPATEWATDYIPGASQTFTELAAMEAAVQTNRAAAISRPLQIDNTLVPSASLPAEWSNYGFVQTRPAGVAATLLMATLQNDSAVHLERIHVAYNLTAAAPAQEQIIGHKVYYSLSGEPGTWVQIPALSGQTSPVLEALIDLYIPWFPGAYLFLLWVDDNSAASPDVAYQIDNFVMGLGNVIPGFERHPTNTSILQCRAGTLSIAIEGGFPATLAWYKDGMPIDPFLNPTASSSTLVLSNVQPHDAGTYFFRATNMFGWAQSSNATVTIDLDTAPPTIMHAAWDAFDPSRVIVTFSEPVGHDALVDYAWAIESTLGETPLFVTPMGIFTTSTHNQIALTADGRDPGHCFTITSMGDVSDACAGNVMPAGARACIESSIAFREGLPGYTGTQDTQLRENTPDSAAEGSDGIVLSAFTGPDGAESQSLLRFNHIFGPASSQIPFGAIIRKATLRMHTGVAVLSPLRMLRMLAPWDETSTWNSMRNGIDETNGVETASTDALLYGGIQPQDYDITPAIQGWANGEPNYGWVFISSGATLTWITSEYENLEFRPTLLVEFACPANRRVSITRNVDGTLTITRACGTLQQTLALTGGWTDSPDQSNPLIIPATAAAQFYRVRD